MSEWNVTVINIDGRPVVPWLGHPDRIRNDSASDGFTEVITSEDLVVFVRTPEAIRNNRGKVLMWIFTRKEE